MSASTENPAILFGLSPPNSKPRNLVPTLNPSSFDKSEPIRSRFVRAGTLDVLGCILEAWLAGKVFAVGPSSSATGMPRETRQQRLARRQAAATQREREQAVELLRALQRQIQVDSFSGVVYGSEVCLYHFYSFCGRLTWYIIHRTTP